MYDTTCRRVPQLMGVQRNKKKKNEALGPMTHWEPLGAWRPIGNRMGLSPATMDPCACLGEPGAACESAAWDNKRESLPNGQHAASSLKSAGLSVVHWRSCKLSSAFKRAELQKVLLSFFFSCSVLEYCYYFFMALNNPFSLPRQESCTPLDVIAFSGF